MDPWDYYDRHGQPITRAQWTATYNEPEKRIEWTEIGDVVVSTVWLGLNHQYGDGPPLIFETLIMGGHLDGWAERYSSETEAEEGHWHEVAKVRKAQQPWRVFARKVVAAVKAFGRAA